MASFSKLYLLALFALLYSASFVLSASAADPSGKTEVYLNSVNAIRTVCQQKLNVRLKAQFLPSQLSAYCDCSAEGITAELSEDEFKQLYSQGAQTVLENSSFSSVVQDCMEKHLLSD